MRIDFIFIYFLSGLCSQLGTIEVLHRQLKDWKKPLSRIEDLREFSCLGDGLLFLKRLRICRELRQKVKRRLSSSTLLLKILRRIHRDLLWLETFFACNRLILVWYNVPISGYYQFAIYQSFWRLYEIMLY